MKAEYDFSKGERGKFYNPKAVFNLPIYLEKDVNEFIRKLADEKGKDVGEIVNEWLRGKMQLTLKKHIDDIRNELKKKEFPNEAAVSDGIVRRLLNALDWPIFNTQIVHPEYPVGRRRVDFALCYPESTPQVFIEVKQVVNIEWADEQLFEYVLDYDGVIPIAILTNGRKWQFFHRMGEKKYREGKIREIDFIKDDSEEIAYFLNRYLNYQSIRSGEAVGAIKKDYEILWQQRQEGLESKSVPPIPLELRHTIVLPNAEDNRVFVKAAWEVACLRWGSSKEGSVPWEDVEAMLPTQFSLDCILKNDFYARCVKNLILTTRTAKQFHNWVRNYPRMPKRFGNIMGLSPERVEQMVDEVTNIHNGTNREEHNDDPDSDF